MSLFHISAFFTIVGTTSRIMNAKTKDRQDAQKHSYNNTKHPWSEANIISRLLFWWLVPIIQIGNRRALGEKDLYKVVSKDESERLGLALEREWSELVEKCKHSSKDERPSFTRALFSTFGSETHFPAFLIFVEECIVKIGQPLCLSQLISYFDPNSEMSMEFAYLYATGVVAGSAFITLSHHLLCFNTQHIGMKARVASCSLIYRKSLRLSQKALIETAVSQMINLISNDANRFDQVFVYIHYLWIGPLQIILTTIVLYYYIGVSSLVGLVIMIGLLVPLQGKIGKMFSRFRRETSKRTDDRIRTINEIIPAIRVLKMYAWERPFLELTQCYRKLEMKIIRRNSYLRAFNLNLAFISSKLLIFPTLVVFSVLGNELKPNMVFLIVALFNNIRMSMPASFNLAIQFGAEAKVSVKRMEDFLLLDEMLENSYNRSNHDQETNIKGNDSIIELSQVDVKWPVSSSENGKNTLTDVSFKVQSGQLLTVTGNIGSGKSTLLNVILGELPILKGSCKVIGKIAYCSQEPWIYNGSIQQMILCGKEMDQEQYYRVIQAAALEKDLKQLPMGDSSIIGEGGVSLSGGQKARVNLARCLYVDADIYLLDDPLSAVDAHVSDHIFQNAIKGLLRSKICILVTHQLQHLKDMDNVLLLKSGRVEFSGKYRQFQNLCLDLDDILLDEPNKADGEDINDDVLVEEDSVLSSIGRKSFLKHVRLESRRESRNSSAKSLKITSNRESNRLKAKRSMMSLTEENQDKKPITVGVSGSTYLKYFRSGSNVLSLILLALVLVVAELLSCASDYWLKMWTSAEMVHWNNSIYNTNSTFAEQQIVPLLGTYLVLDRETGIFIFSILIIGVFIFGYLRALQFFRICMAASVALHEQMFRAVLRSPVQFFDQNSVGVIMNRFTKDIGSMDDQVPQLLFDPIWIGLNTFGAVVTVAIVNYWLLIPALFLSVVFWFIRRKYLKASCGVKRLEASTKSPIFTQLYSSIIGLTTLRAHHCQAYFRRDFDRYQDIHSSAWFLTFALARWLSVWMDLIVAFYVACITYACVALHDSLGKSEAGLIISVAMSLGRFQFGIRQSAEMENQMTSVDRVIEYSKLPSEASLECSSKPPSNWPCSGKIQFENMSLRYSSTDPPVLKNINCTINPQEMIGIVGRSGAGKSTLVAALFRLTEPDGKVLIDGVNIKTIGLHDLRSRISIIPQEPFLFTGSIRTNLDPSGQFSDQVLWRAIKDVHLELFMATECGSTEKSLLDFEVSEGGVNLSVGQKQLVCLARVILYNNRILVLDEATASIDKETDTFIQLIIREKFQNCTVLTIAHRLNTIMDSDKILVFDSGQLSEFDEPRRLLSNPSGIFYSLVEQNGPEGMKELVDIAQEAYNSRKNGASFAVQNSLDTNGIENIEDETDF